MVSILATNGVIYTEETSAASGTLGTAADMVPVVAPPWEMAPKTITVGMVVAVTGTVAAMAETAAVVAGMAAVVAVAAAATVDGPAEVEETAMGVPMLLRRTTKATKRKPHRLVISQDNKTSRRATTCGGARPKCQWGQSSPCTPITSR